MISLSNDLIFFIHVPKTAGSTINYYLKEFLGTGYEHCESFIRNSEELKRRVEKAKWLSGHVTYDEARRVLGDITDRKIRFFTCIRDPYEQILSHFNWLIEIYKKGKGFFYAHPVEIQKISFEISALEIHKNPKYKMMYIMLKYSELFLNCQYRYIVPDEIRKSNEDITQSIHKYYDFICNSNNINILLKKMGIHATKKEIMENVSDYHFNKKIIFDKEFIDFLEIHNGLDISLYRSLFGATILET